MDSTNPFKVFPTFGLDKLKKVTWSENLTDVKVITPQPSVFDNFAAIVFLEEEEEDQEIRIKIKKPLTFSDSELISGNELNASGNHENKVKSK